MTSWEEEQDDLFYEAPEAREKAKIIVEHLENAGCCETLKDFRANVSEALEVLGELEGDLEDLSIRARKVKT